MQSSGIVHWGLGETMQLHGNAVKTKTEFRVSKKQGINHLTNAGPWDQGPEPDGGMLK